MGKGETPMRNKKAITYWVMNGREPLMAVRGKPMLNAREVKDMALEQLEVAPGVFCPQGVSPCEMRTKVIFGTVRVYE